MAKLRVSFGHLTLKKKGHCQNFTGATPRWILCAGGHTGKAKCSGRPTGWSRKRHGFSLSRAVAPSEYIPSEYVFRCLDSGSDTYVGTWIQPALVDRKLDKLKCVDWCASGLSVRDVPCRHWKSWGLTKIYKKACNSMHTTLTNSGKTTRVIPSEEYLGNLRQTGPSVLMRFRQCVHSCMRLRWSAQVYKKEEAC